MQIFFKLLIWNIFLRFCRGNNDIKIICDKINDKGNIKDILNELSSFSNELLEKMKSEAINNDRSVCLHVKFDSDSVYYLNNPIKKIFQTNFNKTETYVLVICIEKNFKNEKKFYNFIGDLLRKCDKKIKKNEEEYEIRNKNVKYSDTPGRSNREAKKSKEEYEMSRITIKNVDDIFIFRKKYKNYKCFLFKFKNLSSLTTLNNIINGIKYDSKKEYDRTISIVFNNTLTTYEGIMILNCLKNNSDKNISELLLFIKDKEIYKYENLIDLKKQIHDLCTNTISLFMYMTYDPRVETTDNINICQSVLSLYRLNLSDNNYDEVVTQKMFDFSFPFLENQKSENRVIKIDNVYILPEVLFKYSVRKKYNIFKPTTIRFHLKFSFAIFFDIKHFKKYIFHFIYNREGNILNMWCIEVEEKNIQKIYFCRKDTAINEMKKLFEKIKKI